MNFSFIIKALILSITVFMIVFSISFISSQKSLLDNNNYGVRDTVKESIDIAKYRISGEITFDTEQLVRSTIDNYLKNNNLKIDEVTFEIALDEVNDIVTVKIYTSKNLFNLNSDASYMFSYQVVERK